MRAARCSVDVEISPAGAEGNAVGVDPERILELRIRAPRPEVPRHVEGPERGSDHARLELGHLEEKWLDSGPQAFEACGCTRGMRFTETTSSFRAVDHHTDESQALGDVKGGVA